MRPALGTATSRARLDKAVKSASPAVVLDRETSQHALIYRQSLNMDNGDSTIKRLKGNPKKAYDLSDAYRSVTKSQFTTLNQADM